ncbi:hypothetical protein [Novosphingobium sp. NDB2Meth1]|uniref:hypothetical protein n=1 Tax=Novosphingobium sp. NDB2Meth1 TaxID=1892847 RepID=UPI0009309A6B|nr:hypothetical protein [Novosphingobium sp. NDB2Meth1]
MPDAFTFEKRRELALSILTKGERTSRRAGSFLGQLIVDPTPMTEAQAKWFDQLVERAGLPEAEEA